MDRPCQFSEGARLDRILPIFKASYRTLRNAGLSREELSGKLLGSPRTSSKYFGSTTLSYSRNVSFTGSSVPASDIRTGRVRSPSESMLFGQCNETHLQQCADAQVDRQSCLYMGRRKACKTCFPREIGRAEQIPKKGEVSAIHADLVGLLKGKPLAIVFVRSSLLSGLLCLPPLRPASFLRSANTGNCGGGHLATFPGNNRNDLLALGFGPPGTLGCSDPSATSGGDCPSASAAC